MARNEVRQQCQQVVWNESIIHEDSNSNNKNWVMKLFLLKFTAHFKYGTRISFPFVQAQIQWIRNKIWTIWAHSATAAQISIAIVSFNKIPTSNCARIVLTIKRLTFRVQVMPFSSLLLIFVHSLARLTLDMIFNFLISFTFNFMFFFSFIFIFSCAASFSCLTKKFEIQSIDIHYIEIYLRCNFISILISHLTLCVLLNGLCNGTEMNGKLSAASEIAFELDF